MIKISSKLTTNTKTNSPAVRQENQNPHLFVKRSVRKVSDKRYSAIRAQFIKSYALAQSLENEVATLERIIKERRIVEGPDPAIKNDKEKVIHLKSFELPYYKKQLAEKKAGLKFAKKNLQRESRVLGAASSQSVQATKEKLRIYNKREQLAREAVKNISEIQTHINKAVANLSKKKDIRIQSLKATALNDGRKFSSDFQKLIRQEITDERYRSMISASPIVRSQLARTVRKSFGYSK